VLAPPFRIQLMYIFLMLGGFLDPYDGIEDRPALFSMQAYNNMV
jgi:hypothetical protein